MEIGPLECDLIEGELDTDCRLFREAAEEFIKESQMVGPRFAPLFFPANN